VIQPILFGKWYYRNAWWSKARSCWMDEKFHVLDNVWLSHRGDRDVEAQPADDPQPRSAFVWNDVIFRSFQSGNLKSIDFDFFKELKSAIAKRLYRFLDKRFFHRDRWEFNLQEFAWEHAGLARSYDAAGLKRKLRPGIAELEEKGYLQPLSDGEKTREKGEALTEATALQRILLRRGGSGAAACRTALLEGYALRRLRAAEAGEPICVGLTFEGLGSRIGRHRPAKHRGAGRLHQGPGGTGQDRGVSG
jgi:hypothetical protein